MAMTDPTWMMVSDRVLFSFVGPIPVSGRPGVLSSAAAVVHVGTVIVSLINVTLPLRASSLPSMFAPFATVIDVRARMLPLNTAVVSMVAVFTRQKTLHAWA